MAFMEVAVGEEASLPVHPPRQFTLEARVFMEERVAREEGLPVPTHHQEVHTVAVAGVALGGVQHRHLTAAMAGAERSV